MKKLVCIHGNPLNGQEFESLIPKLQQIGYQPVLHKRPLKSSKLEPLLQSINATVKLAGGGPFTLVAYSEGAYLALAYWRRFPENVNGILLINPIAVDHKPLTLGFRTLLKTPLVRSIVLKFRSRKLAAAYIHRIFDPLEPSVETRTSLQAFLGHSQVWRTETSYKKLMLSSPLKNQFPQETIPVRALFGEKDHLAQKDEQMTLLQQISSLKCITVPGAGHALPWTHEETIIEELSKLNA
jgi:pimeloyl-ACP methyl ester carboxylesterase